MFYYLTQRIKVKSFYSSKKVANATSSQRKIQY